MEIAVITLLALVTVGLIGYPLINAREGYAGEMVLADPGLENLLVQRDATYQAIKELEFDKEMGSLSEADYQDLKKRYTQKAVSVLKTIDEYGSGGPSDAEDTGDWIESQVKTIRTGKTTGRQAPARSRSRQVMYCPQCGSSCSEEARFCASCGADLSEPEVDDLTCPGCKAPYQVGDRFCSWCGTALVAERPPGAGKDKAAEKAGRRGQ